MRREPAWEGIRKAWVQMMARRLKPQRNQRVAILRELGGVSRLIMRRAKLVAILSSKMDLGGGRFEIFSEVANFTLESLKKGEI